MAFNCASLEDMMPSCSPSGPINQKYKKMSDMDDKNPIKYVLIGDSSTMKIITEYSSGNVEAKTKKEINRIFNKLAKLPNIK